jgi:hypothetical protein
MNQLVEASAVRQSAGLNTSEEREYRWSMPYTIREAVGIFHRSENLQGAIAELLDSGFRAELPAGQREHRAGQTWLPLRKGQCAGGRPHSPALNLLSAEAIAGAEDGLIAGLGMLEP